MNLLVSFLDCVDMENTIIFLKAYVLYGSKTWTIGR